MGGVGGGRPPKDRERDAEFQRFENQHTRADDLKYQRNKEREGERSRCRKSDSPKDTNSRKNSHEYSREHSISWGFVSIINTLIIIRSYLIYQRYDIYDTFNKNDEFKPKYSNMIALDDECDLGELIVINKVEIEPQFRGN